LADAAVAADAAVFAAVARNDSNQAAIVEVTGVMRILRVG
jgi:hypothetical protein